MIIATYSGALLVGITLVASVVTLIAGAAVWSVFRGTRAQMLSQAQSTTLDTLETELNAQKSRADRLEDENKAKGILMLAQDARLTEQQNQINHLREMVTQAAKVDDLISTVISGFIKLGVPREDLIAHKRRGNGQQQ